MVVVTASTEVKPAPPSSCTVTPATPGPASTPGSTPDPVVSRNTKLPIEAVFTCAATVPHVCRRLLTTILELASPVRSIENVTVTLTFTACVGVVSATGLGLGKP